MRFWPLFIVIWVACAGGGPEIPPRQSPASPPADALVMRDAVHVDAASSPLGAACTREQPCGEGLTCQTGLYAFGGYCAAPGCAACAGSCVGTARGDFCMARCERDAECRVAEGYVCDPAWKACVMPNATAIVPRTCPAARGIGRDPAFAPTTALVDANQTASAIASDGRLVTVHAALFGPEARDPSLAHAGGVWFAAWSAGAVMFATSRDGASWSTPVELDKSAGRPVVIAGAGVVHVMFAHEGLRVRTSRDGGKTFDAARTIAAGGYGNAALGPDGRLHVVSIDGSALGAYGSANQRIQYANGGKPVTVSRRDEVVPFHFANPSIAIDARRRWIYIAYVRGGRDARWDLVLAASKDGGATWSRTRIGDDPPCAIHMVPNLALDPTTGTLHVAWYDSRGDKPRFAHATCKPGLVGCMQVGRINDVPFATLHTVRGNPTWVGDYETLLVDDRRRTLHAVWTQPVDDGGKIVSRVFHAKAKLPLR